MFQLFLVNGISLILTDIETIILEQFLYNYPIPIIELLDIKTVLLIYIG